MDYYEYQRRANIQRMHFKLGQVLIYDGLHSGDDEKIIKGLLEWTEAWDMI